MNPFTFIRCHFLALCAEPKSLQFFARNRSPVWGRALDCCEIAFQVLALAADCVWLAMVMTWGDFLRNAVVFVKQLLVQFMAACGVVEGRNGFWVFFGAVWG